MHACIPIYSPVAGSARIRCIEFAGGPHGVVEHTGPASTLLEGFQHLADGIRRSLPLDATVALDHTDLCFPVRKKAKS